MPTVEDEKGKVISRQPYTAEGEAIAADIASSNLNWEVHYSPGGQYDASARNVVDYAGSGKTGYNKIGMNPHMPQPNEKDMY